jgi:hypothetical protein
VLHTSLYGVAFPFSWRNCSFYRHGTDLQKSTGTCRNAWSGPDRKHRFLYCCEGMFTVPLLSNRNSIVACTLVAGMCLATRCLAMDIHVTISLNKLHPKWPSVECWCPPYFPWKTLYSLKTWIRCFADQALFIITWNWWTLPAAHQSLNLFGRNWGMRVLVLAGWSSNKYHALSAIHVSGISCWKYYIPKYTGCQISGPIVT